MRVFLLFFCFISASSPLLAKDKLAVVATFSILGDIIQNVGGDNVTVNTIVGRNEDTHIYNPSPKDSTLILKADLVVINGLGFETWFQRLVTASGYRGPVLVASDGIAYIKLLDAHLSKNPVPDPHVWNDVNNVILWAVNVQKALQKIDPENAALYEANAKNYVQQLKELDTWIHGQFKGVPPKLCKVITAHDAFHYFQKAYGLVFKAPQGLSTVDEPSAFEMASLIEMIKKEKISTIFVENITSQHLIKQLANEAGIKIGGTLYSDALSKTSEPGATYIKLMRHNVTQLVSSLNCFAKIKG